MKSPSKKAKLPPEQSDIVISPEGRVQISFLWSDLDSLRSSLREERDEKNIPFVPSVGMTHTPASTRLEFPTGEYEACHLCPKRCGINRLNRAHPTCGDYRLRVATAGLSFGDEPEIRGTRGSGVIMLSGCPLRCPSCHNPEMVAKGETFSPEEFVSLVFSLKSQGAHNIQLLSPTVHLPVLRTILSELKRAKFDIPIVLKSSGYERVEEIEKLSGLVDIYLPDLKFGSCSNWAGRAGVRDYFAVATLAIAEMERQVGAFQVDREGVAMRGLLVRHVKAPLPLSERAEILDFLSRLPKSIRVSVTDNFVTLE